MDVAIKRDSKDPGFAVIRNYAPARIERELLAQVFDIVQQRELLRDSTSSAVTGDDLDSNAHGDVRDDQRIALEAAA